MTNLKAFLKKIIELEILGIPVSTTAKPLSEIYLINLDKIAECFVAMQHPEYLKLTTLSSVEVLINWQCAYGETVFGKTEIEKQVIEAKEAAFRCLSQICEEDISIENLIRHKDNPNAMSILGMINYYGLGIKQNQTLGVDYLNCAARNKCYDALVWLLCKQPEKSEEILGYMAILPEVMASPELIEGWKAHCNIQNPMIDFGLMTKMGF